MPSYQDARKMFTWWKARKSGMSDYDAQLWAWTTLRPNPENVRDAFVIFYEAGHWRDVQDCIELAREHHAVPEDGLLVVQAWLNVRTSATADPQEKSAIMKASHTFIRELKNGSITQTPRKEAV
jgi:hypothetical protein